MCGSRFEINVPTSTLTTTQFKEGSCSNKHLKIVLQYHIWAIVSDLDFSTVSIVRRCYVPYLKTEIQRDRKAERQKNRETEQQIDRKTEK